MLSQLVTIGESYLDGYGDRLNRHLVDLPDELHWSCCVCVPCYKEGVAVVELHKSIEVAAQASEAGRASLHSASKPLIIYCINQREDGATNSYNDRRSNEASWRALAERSLDSQLTTPTRDELPMPYWRSSCQGLQIFLGTYCDILLIDNFRKGRELASNEGVGQARKIAVDLALRLYLLGSVVCPFIYNTDADAVVPTDYFTSASGRDPERIGAIIHPFKHRQDSGNIASHSTVEATAAYEAFLNYYVEGLTYAKSPYGFATVGSTIIVSLVAYCQVRGFPRRSAGEDFYLLNKIAKVSEVVTLVKSPLLLRCRSSDRVPFGTGAAVAKMVARHPDLSAYTVYDPQSFLVLKALIETLNDLPDRADDLLENLETSLHGSLTAAMAQSLDGSTSLNQRNSGQAIAGGSKVSNCSATASRIIKELKLIKGLSSALSSSPDPAVQRRHIHHYFDAFLTMKFLHLMRDLILPPVPWQAALNNWQTLRHQPLTP